MAFDAFVKLLLLSSSVFIIVAPTGGQIYGLGPPPNAILGGPFIPMYPPSNMLNGNFLFPDQQIFIRPFMGPVWNVGFRRPHWKIRNLPVQQPNIVIQTNREFTREMNHINRPVIRTVAVPTNQNNNLRPVSPKPEMDKKQTPLNFVRPHPKPIIPVSQRKKAIFRGIAKAKSFNRLIGG